MSDPAAPRFASDPATAAYYQQRAAEYDDWYLGTGVFADRDRPGWAAEVERLTVLLAHLTPRRTLDVACGSGFLTRHLPGQLTAVDQSPAMVAITRGRVPDATVLTADALRLPFPDGAFERVFSGHFYGHLPAGERDRFLTEARRVASELVIVDTARRPGTPSQRWDERALNDGSRHRVFKRFLTAAELAEEIDGEIILDGAWFVAAGSVRR